jgi:hypothetical protein
MGLGSGIRKNVFWIQGVKKAPDPGSGSATLVPLYVVPSLCLSNKQGVVPPESRRGKTPLFPGKEGRKITLLANHFSVKFVKDKNNKSKVSTLKYSYRTQSRSVRSH